ncbi:hypothetical protein ACFQQB_37360 [Nonomuraea rubra]|uniref:hypothetical protein n=1 Tax=Nonomuraea rubra TaxID=46180 RepID=UPI00361FEEAC
MLAHEVLGWRDRHLVGLLRGGVGVAALLACRVVPQPASIAEPQARATGRPSISRRRTLGVSRSSRVSSPIVGLPDSPDQSRCGPVGPHHHECLPDRE